MPAKSFNSQLPLSLPPKTIDVLEYGAKSAIVNPETHNAE
jgi:hypothetical protein